MDATHSRLEPWLQLLRRPLVTGLFQQAVIVNMGTGSPVTDAPLSITDIADYLEMDRDALAEELFG
jgi:hypothetical protein